MRTGRPSRSGHPTKAVTIRIPIYLLTSAAAQQINLTDFVTESLKNRLDLKQNPTIIESPDMIIDEIMKRWDEFFIYLRSYGHKHFITDISPPPFFVHDKTPDPFMEKKIRAETPGFPCVTKGWIRLNWPEIIEKAAELGYVKRPVPLERFHVVKGHTPSSGALGVDGRFTDPKGE